MLGALRDLTAALQRTASGLVGYLEIQLQDGRLDAEQPYGDDPIAAVAAVGAALDHAQLHVGTAAGMFADAQSAAGALNEVPDAELAGECGMAGSCPWRTLSGSPPAVQAPP